MRKTSNFCLPVLRCAVITTRFHTVRTVAAGDCGWFLFVCMQCTSSQVQFEKRQWITVVSVMSICLRLCLEHGYKVLDIRWLGLRTFRLDVTRYDWYFPLQSMACIVVSSPRFKCPSIVTSYYEIIGALVLFSICLPVGLMYGVSYRTEYDVLSRSSFQLTVNNLSLLW